MTDHIHISGHSHTYDSPDIVTKLLLKRYYEPAILKQLYGRPVFNDTPDKEPPMSTLDKIIAERREARERERINFLYQAYDNAHYDNLDDGTALRFSVDDEWFAAVIDDGRWSVTGVGTPNGLPTEDFVAWLIGKDIEVADIEVIVP